MDMKISSVLVAESSETNTALKKDVSITPTPQISEVVNPITVTWENIGVTASSPTNWRWKNGGNSKILLRQVSGSARPGELVAIMGASGSGKTTLLNVLMDRNMRGLEKTGTVLVNGQEIGADISLLSGFAQQQELFVPTLTVDEYLMVQADLRIPDQSARRQKVDEVLEMLGLEKCRHVRIGTPGLSKGISGGEARRLTFACELLSNPSLLFADEPTSGLDSFMAATVVQILKRLAGSGRTLIATLHQPTSELFFSFDKVIFLSLGRCAFMGTPAESIQFFSDSGYPIPKGFNPAEWIQSQLSIKPGEEEQSQTRIEELIAKYESSVIVDSPGSSATETSLPPFIENPGVITETCALFRRASLDVLRSPAQMRAKMLQKVIMGLFIGSLYWQQPLDRRGVQNTNSALYFLIAELTFSTMFGIMTFLEHEIALIARDYHDGLFYVLSYYISRCLAFLPLFTLDGVVLIIISYWMIGLNSTWHQVLRNVLVSVLVEQAATSFGLFLACLFGTASTAIAFAVPISGLFALLSGLYGNVNNFPVFIKWMQWTSWFRYGFEGLVVNQWSQIDNEKWDEKYRDVILSQYSFNSNNYWLDVLGLLTIVLIFYLLAYFALLFRIRISR